MVARWNTNRRGLLAALALTLVLAACGGNPPPVPPPPSPSGGVIGGVGSFGACAGAVGALPVNPSGLPYSGTMVDYNGRQTSSSISTTLFYQTAFNGGATYQNIVGSSQLVMPSLASLNPTNPSTSYCVSTTDATSGAVTPGRWANSAVQLIQRGIFPVNRSGFGGFTGGFTGGGIGGTSYNDILEVRIGYSCDAWLDNNRLNGCVDVLLQYSGVYLQLYAQ
jgi:hypothetical protein